MDTIGLDLHKRESQLSIIGSQREITEKRIVTNRERFTGVGSSATSRNRKVAGSSPDNSRQKTQSVTVSNGRWDGEAYRCRRCSYRLPIIRRGLQHRVVP